jgi:GDSL-like Lipase/Acylhydrolase family
MSQNIPAGKNTFVDINGKPLVGGQVFNYLVGTTTPKTTYQDSALTTPNTNPIILDGRGQCSMYGTGPYRQIVQDATSVTIWDQVVLDPGDVAQVLVSGLAADLANSADPAKGSALIGHEASTVKLVLDSLTTSVNNNASAITTNATKAGNTNKLFANTLEPAVIDLHFGTQAGTGWSASEPGNVVSTTTTAGAAQNTTDIPVVSAATFYAGQLICWLATDNQYYSGTVAAILGGPILRLDRQLPISIASGALVYNWFRDDAHGNQFGFNTVADDALRQLGAKRISRLEYSGPDGSIWAPILGATLTSIPNTTTYSNPGGNQIGQRAISVFSNTVGAGCASAWVALQGGDHTANVVVNPGTRTGGFSGSVDISIDELVADGTIYQIATLTGILSYGGIVSKNIDFNIRQGSSVRIRITSPNSGGFTFYPGIIKYHRNAGFLNTLNRGKHVLLGDSWFAGGDIFNRLVTLLPLATLVNKGVSGNKASDLIARFATDVTPNAPDYVWVMIGTNDYYASVTPGLFEQQILQLRAMIQGIGAQPIFFNAAVGAYAPTLGGGNQLLTSRGYALAVRYTGQELQPDGAGIVSRSAQFSNVVTLAASATAILGICPGQTRLPAMIRFLTQSITGLTLSVEYSSVADGSGVVDSNTFTGVGPFKDTPATRATNDLRFVVVRATNGTGSSITATILSDICWQQSLV